MMLLVETVGLIAAGVGCALLVRHFLTPHRKPGVHTPAH
jgi:hypothetical protein